MKNVEVGAFPTIISLKGLNQRGKNRVHQFGPHFFLKKALGNKTFPDKILVEAVTANFRVSAELMPWSGWLKPGEEIEILS